MIAEVINLEKLTKGLKKSIEITDRIEQEVQTILDAKYGSLKLKALSTYLRPYINHQATIAVFKEKDWRDCKRNKIVFSIHVDECEFKCLESIIAGRIKES